jgi:cyclopropane-fatty-acyl-phospholipid synthase
MITALVDRGLVPDPVIRLGIRRLLAQRLRDERSRQPADPAARLAHWVARLSAEPVALATDAANRQHYEVPADFYRSVLGPHLKYSCCLWRDGVSTLAAAEEAMLDLTTRRARIEDGQTVLDLGCGWGALSLYLAGRFPRCRILAVSNSRSQGAWIVTEAARRGLTNVQHQIADVNAFAPAGRFDRIVSVEMFEHVRNYAVLFERIAGWLRPGGQLFVHVFCHRDLTYAFEDEGPGDWMARHFFTGGLMPAAGLLPAFAPPGSPLTLAEQWPVPGTHYQKTSEAWLARLDAERDTVLALFEKTYGPGQGRLWLERWRIFFMACAELFGWASGEEWRVEHYLFAGRGAGGSFDRSTISP